MIGALLEMPRPRKDADDLPNAFGRRLRNLRKSRDLTQEQAAARIGLSADGFETRAVADQLGHSSTSMTESRYIGSVPEMLRQASDRLDAILSPDEPPPSDEVAEQ